MNWLRKKIVMWLFPTTSTETVERLTKKKTPVSVFQSNDLEIDKQRLDKEEEENNRLPHETTNTKTT